MAAGDNSTVQIQIMVTDGGSAATIQNVETKLNTLSVGAVASTQKLAAMKGSLAEIGAAGTTSAAAMNEFRTTGTQAASDVAQSFEPVKGNIREVGGLGRELGLNLGYSLKHAVADNEVLMGALRSLGGLFIAIGAIDIGVQLAKGMGELYEHWLNVNQAADLYFESVKKTQEEDVVNVRSLEDAQTRLRDLNTEMVSLGSLSKDLMQSGLSQLLTSPSTALASILSGHAIAGQSVKAGQQGDEVTQKQVEMEHQLRDAKIEAAHAGDSALMGESKITAELQKQLALHAEQQRFTHQEDQMHGNRAAPDSGRQLQTQQDAAARAAAHAQEITAARQENEQIIQMQNQAVDAGIKGEALYEEQRQQAIDAVKRKFEEGEISKRAMMAETEAIDMKFHNEKMVRLQQEQYETLKIQQEASQAGLTGIAKIQADSQNKVADLTQNPANAGLSNDALQQRRAAYEQEADQQILVERQKFQQEMNQIGLRSDQQQAAGYAKIEAEAQASLQRIAQAFKETYGQINILDPANIATFVAGLQQEQAAITNVLQNAQRQRVELTQKNDEQIAQIETQAARLSLPPWEAAQQQIIEEYDQRVQKARDELNQQLQYEKLTADDLQSIWSQYYRTIAADAQLANAQMQKQAEQTRDQVAGQLQQMFDNPAKYLENRAKQLMFDILANWMTQLLQFNNGASDILKVLFGMGGQMGTSSNPLDAMKQMFTGGHAGGAAGAANPLSQVGSAFNTAGSTLTTAGSTLTTAGSTLSSSGTMLTSSATQLETAASALTMAANSFASAGATGGGGAGAIGQLTNGLFGGVGSTGAAGTSDLGAQIAQLPNSANDLSGAEALGDQATGAVAMGSTSTALAGSTSATSNILQSQASAMSGAFSSTAGAAAGAGAAGTLGEGMQPTDLPPVSSSGVLGTVPDDATGTGATATQDGSSSLGTALGVAGIGISTGMALASEWSSGNTGAAVLTGAMGGAGIGMMVGGPLGAAIGAGVGALVGFVGSLFSDHGLGKAKQYNDATVLPALQKEEWSFGAGQTGYDQASQDLNNLQIQAQSQCKSFGSAAVTYYNSTIVPEIQAMQAQIDRENKAGRSNVKMSAAQFDSGGVVTSFGDLATGPFSGLVHLRLGERVMNPMASMLHGSTLDAMNAGSSALEMMRRSSPLTGGGSSSGGGGGAIHIHALDSKSVDYWLRNGGAQKIQAAQNANVGRYAGKALG
ncbi:MAG: hypothetical protein WCC87_10345 [Candidatus Korobacteraceae bacterium]